MEPELPALPKQASGNPRKTQSSGEERDLSLIALNKTTNELLDCADQLLTQINRNVQNIWNVVQCYAFFSILGALYLVWVFLNAN
jgi:uncharacterized membrane protein